MFAGYGRSAMELVDIVVVSYNSSDALRRCVEPLAALDSVQVFVVDNDSRDDSLETVSDLRIVSIALRRNGGFASGCNAGWRAGTAPYVLLLNPDATIDETSLTALLERLEREPALGAAGPRIVGTDGALEHSQRRFPRLRTTYAQALFLHRLLPRATWTDEVVRDERAYERAGEADWLSGACLLLRRDVLERIGGLDEGFFHYGEDIDLCLRIRAAGFGIGFEPGATVVHEGGGSAPRAELLPLLASSRIRLARKHEGRLVALAQRLGIALGALTHALASTHGRQFRRGHARSLRVAAFGVRPSHTSRSA
jgi:N-acetylglucosaminyl-diphospho-decaprenol L-rhamnosyltransferase